jgi:hypothetical protein
VEWSQRVLVAIVIIAKTANIMKSVDLYRIYQIGILACTLNVYGQEGSKNVEQRVNSILSQMTLDEKISYIGGTLSLTSSQFHSLIWKRRSTRRSFRPMPG